MSITEQKSFLFLEKLFHQKLYINEECHCKHEFQILIGCTLKVLLPHDWHCSVDIGILSFSLLLQQLSLCTFYLFLLPVHSYLRDFKCNSEEHFDLQLNHWHQIMQFLSMNMK